MQLTATKGRKTNPISTMLVSTMREFARADSGSVARLDARNIEKAAQAPADTQTPGWAAELVATQVYAFFQAAPTSVLGALVPYVTKLTVANSIKVPGHVEPSQAAQFVGEALPVPIISGDLSAGNILRINKLGVIAVASREIVEAGAGTDALLEAVLNESIAMGSDAVLLGNGAGSDLQPAGLGSGVTPLTGSSDAVADTKAMVEASPATGMAAPAWMMHPSQVIGATAANIMTNGTIAGAPVIASMHVTIGDVWLIDGADIVMNAGGAVEFQRTEEAVLHTNDAPAAIADGAGAIASPVQSMYQMGLVAVRAILPVHWVVRDATRIIKTTGATW